MSISCLTGNLKSKAQEYVDAGFSENDAVAEVLNEEYKAIQAALGVTTAQGIITIPQQEISTPVQQEQEQGPVYDLGRITNEEGILISKLLGELMTAYVDVAKDPYILDINGVNEVANTILMLIRQGVPMREVFYFVNQPIIKEYIREASLSNSVSNDKRSSKAQIVGKVLSKRGLGSKNIAEMIFFTEKAIEEGGKSEQDRKGRIYSNFTTEELKKGIETEGADKEFQFKALDVFLELQRQAQVFGEMIRSTSPDTQGFKTFTTMENQLALREKVSKSGMFINYDNMFDSFIGEFWNTKNEFKQEISEFLLSQLPGYKEELDNLKQTLAEINPNPEYQERMIRKIEADFMVFLLNTQGVIRQEPYVNSLFKGSKSVPKLVKRLKQFFEEQGGNVEFDGMPFLNAIIPLVSEQEGGIDAIKPISKRDSAEDKEIIDEAYRVFKSPNEREAINNLLGLGKDADFYQRLNMFSIMQTGINFSPYNFVKYMPAEDYVDMLKSTIKVATGNTLDISDFRNLFILNNLKEFYRKDRNLPFDVEKMQSTGEYILRGKDTEGKTMRIKQKGTDSLLDYSNTIEIIKPVQIGQNIQAPSSEVGNESDYFQLSNGEVTQINPQLEKELMAYLKELGVDIKYVNQIVDAEGNPINAYAKASLVSQVIELTQGRKADTLAEEAAHMITGMLGKDHPIVRQMMTQIPGYDVYDRVKVEYADVYQSEDDFRFEAVGKLIAEHIIKKQPLTREQRNTVDNWWTRLVNILKRLLSKFNFGNVDKQMDIFEKTADDIINRRFTVEQFAPNMSEMFQLRTLRDIGMSYNMSVTGFMSPAINPDQLRIDLNRNKMGDIEIAETTTGSYYFKKNGRKINPVKDYYQKKGLTQSEAVQKLKDIRAEIKPEKFINEEGQELYETVTGEIIPQRVTMVVDQEQFKNKKSKAEVEKIQNDPRSKIARHFGIALHDMYERFTNFGIAKYPNLTSGTGKTFTPAQVAEIPEGMVRSQMDSMAKAADTLLSHISQMQKSIDENGTASIHTEQVLRGTVRGIDTAGTMDVVVIFSDGSASIFDFKFINYKKQLVGNKWIIDPESQVPFYKRRSYEAQIGIYKNMLREIGITDFRETRILPNNIQFKYSKEGIPLLQVNELNPFNDKDTFTRALPVDKELTNNPLLNKILTTLFKQNDMLDAMISKNYKDRERVQKLSIQKEQLSKTIQSIQVNHDVSPLLDTVNNLLRNENRVLQEMNSLEDGNRLYSMFMEMQALSALKDDIIEAISDKETKQKAALEFARMSHLQSRVMAKIREILQDENNDIVNPQRELGFLRSTAFLSKIAQPAFEIARKHIKEAFGNINRDTQTIVEEAEAKRNALKQWADGRGMSLIDAYRKILNPKTKNLIFVFSKEFYDSKTQAIEKEDVAWLKANHEYTTEGKQKFEEALKEFKASIELTVPSEKAREWFTEKWLAQNDLSRDSAWLNKYTLSTYTQVKDPSKWYSAEYKTLLDPANKPLKEYYDWFVEKNRQFNRLVPERIGKSFVPNIQKDMIDVIAQGGSVSVADGWNEMINGLRVRQNDIMETGDGDVIPLIFYDNFLYKNAEGEWEVNTAKKSEDLTSSMILFAESVYRKHHMSNIQHIMDLLKLHLSEQEVIETDFRGRPIWNETKTGFKVKRSDTNLKTFEKLIKGLVYNNKLQGKDFTYEIKGKVYSGTKTVKQAMSFLSAKALGWNYVSAFGNLMGGYANMFIKSSGGLYFNKEQLSKARSMMVNRGKDQNLFHHMAEYFKVEKENWVQRDAARLSASSITRNLTYDKIYLLQQKGDEAIGNTVLMAMLQNYGLDENGNVQRLANLPPGSKSLLDRVQREGDKIIIDGMTNAGKKGNQAFDDFRNRVKYVTRQIKGTNTQEDISGMQTDLAGQVLLQFRSWVAPMVEERYGSLKYTDEVKEWEYGRYRSLMKTLAKDKFLPNLKKIAIDVATLGAIKYKGDTELLTKQYEQWKLDNPDMADKMSQEEYLALREMTIREAMVETRMIAAFFVMLAALGGDWDDDGKADYNKYFATRQFQKLANRAYLELSFFSSPTSFNALIKDPIPIFSLMENVIGLSTNTLDETFDTLMLPFGISDDPKDDPKGKLYYSKKLAIGVRWLDYIIEDYNKGTK